MGAREGIRTDGDVQAVETDEVLAAVAAGELLAVAALGLAGALVDGDLLGAVRATLGVGNSSHGGDEESLHEGHFVGFGGLTGSRFVKGFVVEAKVVD